MNNKCLSIEQEIKSKWVQVLSVYIKIIMRQIIDCTQFVWKNTHWTVGIRRLHFQAYNLNS